MNKKKEMIIKFNEIEMNIANGEIDFSDVIHDKDLVELIRFVIYHVDYLKLYRKGLLMGQKSILNFIDETGHYKDHNYVESYDDSDIR